MEIEEPLEGGNLSGAVVRVGDTVRRPTGPWSPSVHALLRHLADVGFDGAPRFLGLDSQGREVLEYLPGVVAWPPGNPWVLADLEAVWQVGRLLRSFHSAVASFDPGPSAVWRFPDMAADALPFVGDEGVVICHCDATAWNLVVGEERLAFIDWDAAGPRPPIWDLAYCAIGVLPLGGGDLPVAPRLAALAEGYGLAAADRARLPEVIEARASSSLEHMRRRASAGIAPWDRMWAEGHGDAWRQIVEAARSLR